MKFIISGKNMVVTPSLKEAVETKLGRLKKYFTPETEIIVTLSVEKDRQKIEVTIPVKGSIMHRHVRLHRSCRRGNRTPASEIQDQAA